MTTSDIVSFAMLAIIFIGCLACLRQARKIRRAKREWCRKHGLRQEAIGRAEKTT